MRLQPLAALLIFAAPALAGSKGGVYTSAEHKVRFKVPAADFRLRAKNLKLGIPGAIGEFESRDGGMAGVLLPSEGKLKAKEMIKSRGALIEKNAGNCTWESEEKVERDGDWFRAEFTVVMGESELRYIDLATARESDGLELLMWCLDSDIDNRRKTMDDILSSLELGEFADEGDDPEAPPDEVKPTDPVKAPEGTSWADAGGSVTLLKPEGWEQRTQDFAYGDANAVVEFQKGDAGFAYLASVQNEIPMKEFAAAMIGRFESTWEAFKSIGSREGDGVLRHDFRAKVNNAMTRFSIVFFSADGRNWYLVGYAGSTDWRKVETGLESLIGSLSCSGKAVGASVKTKSEAADPGEVTDPADPAGGEVTVPNPWKGCGNGSTAKHRMVSVSGGTQSEMETIATLVDSDDSSYTVRTDIVMNGTTIAGEPQRISLKQKSPGGEAPKTERGDETLTVAKGEFACRWTRTETAQGWSKVWMCDEVPGGVVKMEAQFAGASSISELLDFEKK